MPSDHDIELIRKTIKEVAWRIQCDANNMALSPRPKSAEFTIEAWEKVAQFVLEEESEILFEVTGFDDGV